MLLVGRMSAELRGQTKCCGVGERKSGKECRYRLVWFFSEKFNFEGRSMLQVWRGYIGLVLIGGLVGWLLSLFVCFED